MTTKFSYGHKENPRGIILAFIIAALFFLWVWYANGFDWQMFSVSVILFIVAIYLYIENKSIRKIPPVLAGDTQLLFMSTETHPEGLELPWDNIEKIKYELKQGRRSSLLAFLRVVTNKGDEISVDITDLKAFDINAFQALVKQIAPHIEWVWPNPK